MSGVEHEHEFFIPHWIQRLSGDSGLLHELAVDIDFYVGVALAVVVHWSPEANAVKSRCSFVTVSFMQQFQFCDSFERVLRALGDSHVPSRFDVHAKHELAALTPPAVIGQSFFKPHVIFD